LQCGVGGAWRNDSVCVCIWICFPSYFSSLVSRR